MRFLYLCVNFFRDWWGRLVREVMLLRIGYGVGFGGSFLCFIVELNMNFVIIVVVIIVIVIFF